MRLWEKGSNNWRCAICGEKYDWKQPNRLLVVQTGDSIEQTKVFKAHAAPQGLCINLVSALKSVAYQQEDGDGLLQNIVTNLGKESRKGLTDGLREFMKIDAERALDVGYLNWSTGTFRSSEAESPRRMHGSDSQGEPGRVDFESWRSGYIEGTCQCRPLKKKVAPPLPPPPPPPPARARLSG